MRNDTRNLMMNRGGHVQQYLEIKCFEINFELRYEKKKEKKNNNKKTKKTPHF
jgi:hypothetical protein